jgi:hypothetical protein
VTSPTQSGSNREVADDPYGLVEMLVASPSMLRKFRQDHRPDASGHCRSCRAGADGSGRVMQCSLWLASEAAKRLLGLPPV